MKKTIIMVLAAALFCMPAVAQNVKPEQTKVPAKVQPQKAKATPEQIAKRQSRQIIATLGLAGETAERFSEMYTAYKQEMLSVKDKFPMVRKAEGEGRGLTDQEIEKNILNRFAQAHATVEVREKYYKQFRTLLTPGQIQAMYNQEKTQAAKLVQAAKRKAAGNAAKMPAGKPGVAANRPAGRPAAR